MNWRQTSKYKVQRKDIARSKRIGGDKWHNYFGDHERVCFSHEYVGEPKLSASERAKLILDHVCSRF